MNRISTDDLYEEFTDYQILHDNDITDEVWREAKVVDGLKRDVEDEDGLNHYRVDILWWHILKFAIPVTLVKRFKLLSKPADLVLVMPYGLNHYRVDILWWHILKFAIPVTLVKRFKLLSKPADLVLVMPHGNADLKKLFSIVQKKTG